MKLTKNDAIDVEYLINEGLITSEKDLVGDNRPSSVMFPYMVKKYGYLLNGDLLSEDEKKWLNDYHKTVYEKTAPYLTPEEAQWLAEKTKPVL